MNATTATRKAAERQAWKAYKAACDARGKHADSCMQCWSMKHDECAPWNDLSTQIERTLDAWMLFG